MYHIRNSMYVYVELSIIPTNGKYMRCYAIYFSSLLKSYFSGNYLVRHVFNIIYIYIYINSVSELSNSVHILIFFFF